MDRGAVRGMGRLANRLGHGRVRVDRAKEFLDRALEAKRQCRFRDQLGRAQADHVHAKYLVVLLVEHDLDEALQLAGNLCPAKNPELERARLDVVSASLRFLLGQADASDLGIAVGASGNLVVVNPRRCRSRDALGHRDPLVSSRRSTPARIDHLYEDPHERGARLFLHYGDLSDGSRLTTLLQTVQPHEVYHLAAQSHVRVSFDEPEHTGDTTGIGTTRLLEAIRMIGLDCRFYQASSSEMFGASPPPQDEATPFYPRSPYGAPRSTPTG